MKYSFLGGLFLFIGVLFGALASHVLRDQLSETSMESFQTGVRYLVYHGFALLILPSIQELKQKTKNQIVTLILFGTLLFSGSIFLLATKDLHNLEIGFLGPITPVGGLLLLSSWGLLTIRLFQNRN